MTVTVGTCQFPVTGDVKKNADWIIKQMREARKKGADVAHFCEGALSGYAGNEFPTFEGYNWPLLEEQTERVMAEAKKLRLWVVLGSSHRLSDPLKAHNCHYIINNRGKIVDRYDKMFCCGHRGETSGDFKNYRSGDHFCIFEIKGVKCGVQICHDYRYQETYREHFRRGVRLMFQAFHMGGRKQPKTATGVDREWHKIVPATMMTYSANNAMWISVSNTCRKYNVVPSFFVTLGGIITGKLKNHTPGVLISSFDPKQTLPDPSKPWRDRAMGGIYHSGTLKKDPRTECRTSY